MKSKESQCVECGKWMPDDSHLRCSDCEDKPKQSVGRPAREGQAADGQIQLRTTMARKNAYVQAAKPQKLTAWIFQNLDKAANFSPCPKCGKAMMKMQNGFVCLDIICQRNR